MYPSLRDNSVTPHPKFIDEEEAASKDTLIPIKEQNLGNDDLVTAKTMQKKSSNSIVDNFK